MKYATLFSYKVSVIGCSGPVGSNQNQLGQIDSDLVGIGKSSFCARFMYPDQVLSTVSSRQPATKKKTG